LNKCNDFSVSSAENITICWRELLMRSIVAARNEFSLHEGQPTSGVSKAACLNRNMASISRFGLVFLGLVLFFGAQAMAADGKAAFLTRCSMCHQAAAQGLPGQFPRLAGRAGQIAQTPEGRQYLVRVALWGLVGPIDVDGGTINGVMPGVATTSDDEMSAILNHLIGLGKPTKAARPFKPAEIAAVRAEGRVPGGDNAALRKTLSDSGVIK
jgi:cytochrome c5